MARTTIRPKRKQASGYVLPAEKMQQRETAYAIYRDMGRARTLLKLERELKHDHPAIATSRQTLEKWSKQHDWQARVQAHDDAVKQQVVMAAPKLSPEFNQIDSLLSAAHQALVRALGSTPIVAKASDFKALVDVAMSALKLVEVLQAKQGSGISEKDVANEMSRILELVEQRRLKDLTRQKTSNGQPEEAATQPGIAVDDVDEDEADVEQAPEPAAPPKKPMVAAPQMVGETAAKFAEVLDLFKSKPLDGRAPE